MWWFSRKVKFNLISTAKHRKWQQESDKSDLTLQELWFITQKILQSDLKQQQQQQTLTMINVDFQAISEKLFLNARSSCGSTTTNPNPRLLRTQQNTGATQMQALTYHSCKQTHKDSCKHLHTPSGKLIQFPG